MIEYRPAKPSDAEAIASLHARSWRENYRGALHDAFLDGDLHEERLGVWRERLAVPRQSARAAGRRWHEPGWLRLRVRCPRSRVGLSRRQSSCCPCLQAQRDRVVAPEARRSLARPPVPRLGVYLWVLEVNSSARRFYERLGARERRRLDHGNSRWRRGTQLPVHLATGGAALCYLTRCRSQPGSTQAAGGDRWTT